MAAFLTWTSVGAQVTGSFSLAYPSIDGQSVKTESTAFQGVVNGSSVTLTFTSLYPTAISGRLNDGTLTLSFPQTDGSLAPVTFRPGDATAYNIGVQQLQQRAAAVAASSRQLAAIAANEHDVDLAAGQLASAYDTVQQDVAPLAQLEQQIDTDLATQAADYKTVQTDAAKIVAAVKTVGKGDPDNCSNAYDVESEAYTVQSDGYSVQSDTYGVFSEQIRSDIAALSSARSALEQAQGEAANYATTINYPSSSDVRSLLSGANTALSKWNDKASTATAQADKISNEAVNAATAAASEAGC